MLVKKYRFVSSVVVGLSSGWLRGGAPAFVKAASDRSRNVAERWWARRDHQVIVTRSKDNRQNALSNEGTAEAGGGGGAVKLGAI